MIKLRNKMYLERGSNIYLTVMEGFIPFTIVPNPVPPRPKREEEFKTP